MAAIMLSVVLPLYATIPRKTKKDKKFALDINIYRNLNHFTLNDIKKRIADIVTAQLRANGKVIPLVCPVKVTVNLWFPNKVSRDVANFAPVAQKFADDAVVKYGYLPDDKVPYIIKTEYNFMGYDKINPRFEITYETLNKGVEV